MPLECFLCHKVQEEPNQVSFSSRVGEGIIQVCNECYGVLFK